MFKSLLPWKRTKTKVVVPECTMEEVGTNELVVPKEKLVPCPTCGRTFLPQPLSKHAPICEKTWTKKRKVFDSLRQRVEGTDLAQFHRKTYLKRTVPEVSPKPSDSKIAPKITIHSTSSTNNNRKSESKWEENHLQVLSAIRTAREAAKMADPRPTTSKKSPSSLLPASPNSQCPFCERNFGPKAFDRHVDWCREHSSRIHKSPAVNSQAKERLEARIKYRAPPLRQSKRSMIREKYASLNAYKPKSTTSVVPAGTSDSSSNRKSPSVNHVTVKSKPKSVLELGSRGDKVEVRSPVAKARIAEKKTKSESKLQEPVKSPKSDYNPFECAQRQFQQLLDCDDFVPPAKKISAKSNVDKVENRKSVIEPPATFQDFDPSEDDFEILEQLLNNIDNSNNENKIFRKYSDDMSSIDSNLINENDNLSIPEHFKLDNYSPNSTETLKNVDNVDPYSVEYDNSIESVNRISVKIDSGSSSASDTSANNNTKKNLKKGAILLETLSKPPLMRSREDVNNYFQEKDAINKLSDDNNDNQIENNFTAEELFSVDDEMYEEYKLYEEMYLKDRDGAANSAKKKSSKTNNFDYGVPNIIKSADNADENNPKSSKYIDSAYGSLHRNTPKSEEIKEKIIPRFCHECGTKYPVNWAKFCVECGMKRLVLS